MRLMGVPLNLESIELSFEMTGASIQPEPTLVLVVKLTGHTVISIETSTAKIYQPIVLLEA